MQKYTKKLLMGLAWMFAIIYAPIIFAGLLAKTVHDTFMYGYTTLDKHIGEWIDSIMED